MTWPFKVPDNKPNADPANAESETPPAAPPEKTPAEILAESLSPFKDSIESLRTDLANLKESLKKPEAPPRADPAQPISVLDNEDAAFAQRMTPLLARQLELESRVVYNDIKQEYTHSGFGDLWDKFETEIRKMLESSPLVNAEGKPLRGDPQYVRNVVDMILGRAAREAGIRFDTKTKGFFLEPAGGDAGSLPKPEADGLTESQRKVLSRMGVTAERSKDIMKKLQFVN